MFYFSINVFVFLLSLLQCSKPNLKDHKIFLILIGIFFILLVGLRGSNDEYTRIFVEAPILSNFLDDKTIAINQGLGFAFICSLFSTVGLSSQSLLFSFAFASIFIKFYYFKKYTNYYLLSVFIYLSHTIIHHDWGQIRAGLASSLILPMIYYLHRKNYLVYFIIFFISFSIHYISLISLLLFFSNFKIRPFILLLVLFTAYLFSFFDGLDLFLKFLDSHGLVPIQYTGYLIWDKHNYDVSLLHPKVFQQIFLSLFVIYLFHKFENFKKYYFIINVYILSTFFTISMSSFAILCFRTSMHFISVEPIVIILIFQCFKWRNYLLIFTAVFFIFISYINYIHNQALPDYFLFVNTN